MPAEADRIVFAVSVYRADSRCQSFGMVRNAYIRVVDDANGDELARYDLTEDASADTAMVFGELYRHSGSGSSAASGWGTPAASAASSVFRP